MGDETAWGMVVSFKGLDFGATTEGAFVYGVEFGQLFERMSGGREAEIETTIHATNEVAFRRAAAAKGWDVEIKPCEADGSVYPTYRFMRLTKTAAPEKPNPHGLRVVQ